VLVENGRVFFVFILGEDFKVFKVFRRYKVFLFLKNSIFDEKEFP